MKKLLFLTFFITSIARATTITVTLLTPSQAKVTKDAFVRFELMNYGSNVPRVIGGNVILPSFQDFYPDVNGLVSGIIQGNDTISPVNTYYHVCFYKNGVKFYCCDMIISGASQNINNTSCLVAGTPPVPFDSCVQCGAHATSCPAGQVVIGLDASGNAICAVPPSSVSSSNLLMQDNFCSALSGTTSPSIVNSQLAWTFTMQAFSGSQLISFESSDITSTITHPCNWNLNSGSGVNPNTGGTLVMGITTSTSGRWVNASKQTFSLIGIVANQNNATGRGVLRFGLMDSSDALAPINNALANVFFSTTDGGGVSDTNWTCNQTKFGGAGIDTVDSGVTATHYNNTNYVYHKLQIDASASSTAVVWKIDDVQVCQSMPSTNYPNGSSLDFFIAPTFSAINPTGNLVDSASMLMNFYSMSMTLAR